MTSSLTTYYLPILIMTDSDIIQMTTMETSLRLGPKLVIKAFKQSINGIKSQLNEMCAQIKHRIVFILYSFLLVKTDYNNVYNFETLPIPIWHFYGRYWRIPIMLAINRASLKITAGGGHFGKSLVPVPK